MADPTSTEQSLLLHTLTRLDGSLRDLAAAQIQQTQLVGQLVARIEAHESGLGLVRQQLSQEVARFHDVLEGVVSDYRHADQSVNTRIESVELLASNTRTELQSWVNRGWGISAMLGLVMALAGYLVNLTTDQYKTTILVLTQRIDALEQQKARVDGAVSSGK